MHEHIVCPNCGNKFSLEISEPHTKVVCARCGAEFVHRDDIVPLDENVDPTAETMEMPAAAAGKAGEARRSQTAPFHSHGETSETTSEDTGREREKAGEACARPGMVIGNYEIIEEIGRGAVGVVYKARQKNLNRLVALKILLAGQAASEEQVKRFHQEALAVAKLRHPNIVPVYDVGVHEGKHYFAMEYVEGRPLHHIMKGSRFSPNEALEIILKVAAAISDAHRHGIIHRDIKPANIMIGESGRVQVMDFGLAKEVEADTQFTRSGTTMGTPNYMPVEQAQGDNKNIDARSDIYSLGAVLYEMLTGVPPFVAETNLKTILKVINEEPLPPRRRNPHIHKDIETICIKAMEKDKSRRYDTVGEFMEDIKRFHAGEPILARPPSTIYRVSKKFRKHQAVIAGSLGTVAVIVVFMSLINLIFPPQPPQPHPPPPHAGNNNNNGGGDVRPPQPKKVLLYEGELLSGRKKEEFLKAATGSEQYAANPTLISNLPEGELPEQVEIEMDLMVAPDAYGTLGICLYARTDKRTLDNFYSGFVVILHFRQGALWQATFRNRQSRTPVDVSPTIKPEDGRFRILVWRRGDYVFLSINEGREPFKWSATGPAGLGADHGEGVGIALVGHGLDFGTTSVREIFQPWSELYALARRLFDSNAYEEARKEYERLLNAYSDELRNPDSKIPEEEFVRAELHIAVCLAHEAGLYSVDEPEEPMLRAAAQRLRTIVESYGERFPGPVQTAEEYLFHIRFRTRDIDLTLEARELAEKYDGLEVPVILQELFECFPFPVIEEWVRREACRSLTPEQIETWSQLAQHYIDNRQLEEAAEILQWLTDLYAENGEYDNALEEIKRILSLDFPDRETNIYIKAARIRRARIYLEAGDYRRYDEATAQLFWLYRGDIVYINDEPWFAFDYMLGPHKVEWGRNAFERWFSSADPERNDEDLANAYVRLKECLRYLQPEEPPELDQSALDKMSPAEKKAAIEEWSQNRQIWQAKSYQWRIVILGASAELVRVEYARGTRPALIAKLLEPFKENPNITRELQAKLKTLLTEVYAHYDLHSRARRLCYDVIDNYRDLADAGIRAVDVLVQTRIREGMRKKADLRDINVDDIKNDLALLNLFETREKEKAENKVDAMMKAAFVRAMQYYDYGRDEKGKPTPEGIGVLEDFADIWLQMEETMNRSGLSGESFVRQMHQLMDPRTPQLTDPKIILYRRRMEEQQNPYRKSEMKFALAMRFLLEEDPVDRQEAQDLIEEILRDDKLDEYWFTKLLKDYQRKKKPPSSST